MITKYGVKLTALVLAIFMLVGLFASCGSKPSTQPEQDTTTQKAPDEKTKDTTSSKEETSPADASDKESPMLAEQVSQGSLPPVEDRLPKAPKLVQELREEDLDYELGQYGGTLRFITNAPASTGNLVVGLIEPIIHSPSYSGESFLPNVVEHFESNDDATEYTFVLRDGLRWSDGELVTTDDVSFAINDVMLNEEVTPSPDSRFRTNGVAEGTPMTLEVVDTLTFKLIFDGPYNGFPIKLALQGWPSYDTLIKPAHYLKQFHKDYADPEAFAALLAESSYQEDEWGLLFADEDITVWEMGQPKAVGFPTLAPYIAVSNKNEKISFDRNPYYFKVDPEGRQLPYVDHATVTVVADYEILNNSMIAGEVDLDYGDTEISKMALYKENEDKGYTAQIASYHGRLGNMYYNHNYPDADWQTVIHDLRFRQALSLAIDRENILDTIFFGFGVLPKEIGDGEYSVEKANALLDELGLEERNSEGFRLYPSGNPVKLFLSVSTRVPENGPIAEMLVPMLEEVGIDASFKIEDYNLWVQKLNANEVQGFVERMETYWWMADAKFNYWAPMWNAYQVGGEVSGEEPPEDVKKLFALASDTTSLPIDQGPEAYEQLVAGIKEQYRYIPLMDTSENPLIINSQLGNTDAAFDQITSIIFCFTVEQLYYKQ